MAPVRYIHRASPGATEDYIKLRNMYRSARDLTPEQPSKVLLHYLVHCALDNAGLLISGDLKVAVELDPNTRGHAQEAQRELATLLNRARSVGIDRQMLVYLDALMDKVHELHNELEKRDSYM